MLLIEKKMIFNNLMLHWHDKKFKRNNQHAANALLHSKILFLSETVKLIVPVLLCSKKVQ